MKMSETFPKFRSLSTEFFRTDIRVTPLHKLVTPAYRILNLDRGCEVATHVELALSSSARRTGLLNHSSLEDSTGLWLAPCEAVHTFGMKMPIDVVFLDRKYRTLKLIANLAPSRIALCLCGNSVLELAGGTITRSGLQRGHRLQFQQIRHPLAA